MKKAFTDADKIRNALRPRMGHLPIAGGSAPSNTIPPHTHSADQITFEPAGLLAGDDVQEALEEHDSEKLARDGSQVMLGALDMDHHNINNIVDADVEGDLTVGSDATFTGPIGQAKVSGVRDVSLTGDEGDGEGRIDGVNALVLNEVAPGAAELGRVSLDSTEDTMIVYVTSGSELVQIAEGWSVLIAYNYQAPI